MRTKLCLLVGSFFSVTWRIFLKDQPLCLVLDFQGIYLFRNHTLRGGGSIILTHELMVDGEEKSDQPPQGCLKTCQ